ncbi:MAG TPA: hypothetical protein VGO14_06440 [Solirubrobacteraceae bacterium]|jgi:DNA-binding beta-propeller fold protein YncE|nr:hypothetical protein [Solirubrobacteraceae bacterium]
MTPKGSRRVAAIVSATAAFAAAVAPASDGATVRGFGPLSAGGCLATQGTSADELGQTHCERGRGLVGANSVAVTPDGANVYVVGGAPADSPSLGYGNLAILKRDTTTGAISSVGCMSSDGTDGRDGETGACTATLSLIGADGVAVSPDGHTVYVASGSSASVVAFARDPATGLLTRLGCMQGSPRPGSPCRSANVFVGSSGIVASADGGALYVSASRENVLAALAGPPRSAGAEPAAPATVASIFTTPAVPTYLANPCVAVNGFDGPCAVGVALKGIGGLALSADGRQLYGVAPASKAIDVFSTSPEASLAESGCLVVAAPPGLCGSSKLMESPRTLAGSPDGKNLYVNDSGQNPGRIDVLSRDASSGQLSDASCVDFLPRPEKEESEDPEESADEKREREEERQKRQEEKEHEPPDVCQRFAGVQSVNAVAVSGDGSSVYSFGETSTIFSRDAATGKLSETSCTSREDSRCASLPSLREVRAVAVSPDGRDAYVVGAGKGAIVAYSIGAAVTTARATATRAGAARVRVVCPAAMRRPCTGRVELTARIGGRRAHGRHRARAARVELGASRRFTVWPGRQGLIGVVLSSRARGLLHRHGHLRLAAVVRAGASAGGSGFGRHLLLTLARR